MLDKKKNKNLLSVSTAFFFDFFLTFFTALSSFLHRVVFMFPPTLSWWRSHWQTVLIIRAVGSAFSPEILTVSGVGGSV